MEPLTREAAHVLFVRYRRQRDGIRNSAEMASVCLICESTQVVPKVGAPAMLTCRNCGFSFDRYLCSACGKTVDGRDPRNPLCRKCSGRLCTCGACSCSSTVDGEVVPSCPV